MPTPEGTPVSQIKKGDRFRHWAHGIVTVREKVDGIGRVVLRLDTETGHTADSYRPDTKLRLIKELRRAEMAWHHGWRHKITRNGLPYRHKFKNVYAVYVDLFEDQIRLLAEKTGVGLKEAEEAQYAAMIAGGDVGAPVTVGEWTFADEEVIYNDDESIVIVRGEITMVKQRIRTEESIARFHEEG